MSDVEKITIQKRKQQQIEGVGGGKVCEGGS